MSDYRDYKIKKENNHYKIISPIGDIWREDTYSDAKKSIDDDINENGKG